ncbi:MAG: FliM/FliN family flagellar motor switch protein [Hyphomicrobiaceae bacterium]
MTEALQSQSDTGHPIRTIFSAQSRTIDQNHLTELLNEKIPALALTFQDYSSLLADIEIGALTSAIEDQDLPCTNRLLVSVPIESQAEAHVAMTASHAAIFKLIGIIYGEAADAQAFHTDRLLTELEQHIATHILDALCRKLARALLGKTVKLGDDAMAVDAPLEELEVAGYLYFAQLNITLGEHPPFTIEVGFARELLAALQQTVDTETVTTHSEPDSHWSSLIQNQISSAKVGLTATITCPDTTLAAISDLSPGNIIEIYQTNNSLITIECENEPIFRGNLGRSGGRFAVDVEAPVDQWSEFLCELLFEAEQSNA